MTEMTKLKVRWSILHFCPFFLIINLILHNVHLSYNLIFFFFLLCNFNIVDFLPLYYTLYNMFFLPLDTP